MSNRTEDLKRIEAALGAAAEAVRPFVAGSVAFETKEERGDPLTQADLAVDRVLRETLPRDGEGWLSEETADDPARVGRARCWVVDPIDGTREFVDGIPEWCISVGLVEDGEAVAGGVLNPATGERVVGSVETGVTLNGRIVPPSKDRPLAGARVYASRSEVRRGEWERYQDAPFEVVPCGSVAYKLALVAAGRCDATWTLVPKHEWDVAAGAALVRAAGLEVIHADGSRPGFNQVSPKLPNFLAGPARLLQEFRSGWA
ncbi:MAG: 3'(2'),5'-bisphosphate nucleotidase CysQ [Gemmatimonadota bacterium]